MGWLRDPGKGGEMTSCSRLQFCGVSDPGSAKGLSTVKQLGSLRVARTWAASSSVTFRNDPFEIPQSCTYV